MTFRDREDAGQQLAEKLMVYRDASPVVLGLPRGGVVVAEPVARALGAPLDVLVARKIGAPGHEELAIGAVTARGKRVLNDRVLRFAMLPPRYLEEETDRQRRVAQAREENFRGLVTPVPLAGRTAIVVDDGIATGMTVRAAVEDLLDLPTDARPLAVVVAAPVIAPDTHEWLARMVDAVVAIAVPQDFMAVGQYYERFEQTTDDEVRTLLAGQRAR